MLSHEKMFGTTHVITFNVDGMSTLEMLLNFDVPSVLEENCMHRIKQFFMKTHTMTSAKKSESLGIS